MKYLPVKLTPLEERIYLKDFSRVMDRRTFKDLIKNAYLRTFSDGGQITHHGNNFYGLFYVALINPNYKVTYIKKGKEYFEIKENSWIGVVEYMMLEKEKKKISFESDKNKPKVYDEQSIRKEMHKLEKKIKVKWGLDAVVKESGEIAEINDPIYEHEDDPCYVYEFPLDVLEKLFLDKDEGVIWKNALFSMWLGYTTKAIISVDDKVRKQAERKKASLINTFEFTQTARESVKQLIQPPLNTPNEEDELKYEKNNSGSDRILLKSSENIEVNNEVEPDAINLVVNN